MSAPDAPAPDPIRGSLAGVLRFAEELTERMRAEMVGNGKATREEKQEFALGTAQINAHAKLIIAHVAIEDLALRTRQFDAGVKAIRGTLGNAVEAIEASR